MFGSGVLDTVIGVIFVFLLVSLLVTTGNELLAAIIRSRAKWLQYGIDRLIGSAWAKQLMAHPLIEGSTRDYKPGPDGKLPLLGSGPSYIPSRTFANILMELLHGADDALRQTEAALQKALDLATTGPAAVADIKAAVDQMAASLPAILPARVAAVIKKDLEQLSAILGRNDAARLAAWLGELEGHTRAITDPTLVPVKIALSDLVVAAASGNMNVGLIRQQTLIAIAALPAGAAGDMLRANLNLVLTRLESGYSGADAAADVRHFIQGIPAGYVRHLIEELNDEKMRKTLLALFDDAGNDIEKFKQNIEVWFNNAMDRVGGWYKRRAQWVTGLISLIVVLTMNVDAMLIVRYLDANPGVRKGLVTQAEAFVAAKAKETSPAPSSRTGVVAGDSYTGRLQIAPALTKKTEITLETNAPGGVFRPKTVEADAGASSVDYTLDTAISDEPMKATVTAKDGVTRLGETTVEIQPSYLDELRRVQGQLMGLKLPIGWARDPTKAESDMRLGLKQLRTDFVDVLIYHVLGWLITAIAATLGAPFWFDMLNKIMSIRSAGKAPEEAPKSPEVVQVPTAPGQSPLEASRLAALAKSGNG